MPNPGFNNTEMSKYGTILEGGSDQDQQTGQDKTRSKKKKKRKRKKGTFSGKWLKKERITLINLVFFDNLFNFLNDSRSRTYIFFDSIHTLSNLKQISLTLTKLSLSNMSKLLMLVLVLLLDLVPRVRQAYHEYRS